MHGPHSLPEEFQAHLPDARIARAGHITKQAAVEISSRVVELGVVEQIEELRTKLERHALSYFGVLVNGNIKVIESGPVEEPGIGVAKSAQRAGDKSVLGEEHVRPSRAGQPGILSFQGSHEIRDIRSRR